MKTPTNVILVLFFLPILLSAQWSDDPAVNTYIAGDNYEQIVPHIAVAPDGSYYISSFQSDTTVSFWYDVYLHRLDLDGNKIWNTEGLLISDHPNKSWISDYSLITDPSNAAVVVFGDLRAGSGFLDIYAYRTATDQSFLWGNNGVALSNNLYDEYTPDAIVTDQGNYIFAWTRVYVDTAFKQTVVIQKVDPNGQLMWANEVELFNSDTTYCEPQLIAAANDNFIVVWCRLVRVGSGMGEQWYKYFYAQKFDAAGNQLWPNIVPVCDLDTNANAIPRYVWPVVEGDMNDGVFVSWYDGRINPWTLNTYVQHVDSSGTAAWTQNGILASINSNDYQVEPAMEYISSSDELFVFWKEVNTIPTYQYGLYGQKISTTGQRMWGDNGLVIEPLNPNPYIGYSGLFVKASSADDIALFYNRDSLYASPTDTVVFTDIYTSRIDGAGQYVWNNEKILMASYIGWKMSTDVCDFANDQWVGCWLDDRPAMLWPEKLYAQNISLDGNLGIITGIGEAPGWQDSSFEIYPNPFYSTITITFTLSSSQYAELIIYNLQGQKVRSLVEGEIQKGLNQFVWNGLDDKGNKLPEGIYLCRLLSENSAITRRCIIIK
ncbi:MAG: T9SS type A sorting domain-containing protein [Bacteroidales bacterium]|nr:T9SS type A sorting domain-containing protein [Bacteroidales bacterium]